MRLSLRNKLALVFFAVTLLAIGALYVYVAPGLESRLINEKGTELAAAAARYSPPIARQVRRGTSLAKVEDAVYTAARSSGQRVTLLSGEELRTNPQLRLLADSTSPVASTALGFPVAYRALESGRVETGTESADGTYVEAAYPIRTLSRSSVLVYSAPVSDVVHSVAVVRHQILVAGGIALVLAMIGGYLIARALSRRVKRLEWAAEQVAAGVFERPIPVDSTDELGQLALTFNDMQRQLAQLDLARKKFIATASHELRTPIFSLGGFVELLEDEDLDDETRRRFVEQLRSQVERLRKLSVDLLDLSRLEAGSLELRPEEVDLGELTRSVSDDFEPTLAEHDSELELAVDSPVTVVCDPVRVAQIIRILIDNALTHTPPGTRIVVFAERRNGRARLAVSDDGGGIDGPAQKRIFEPFYTGDDGPGSGLGLAIASELAERMAGGLAVGSEPGATTFTLEIPAGEPAPLRGRRARTARPPRERAGGSGTMGA